MTGIKNVIKEAKQAAVYLANEGHILVSEEEHAERMKVCESNDCGAYSEFVEDECGDCRCPLRTRKAWLASTCCPQRRWYGDIEKTELCSQEEENYG
jgi:hypothetical protein